MGMGFASMACSGDGKKAAPAFRAAVGAALFPRIGLALAGALSGDDEVMRSRPAAKARQVERKACGAPGLRPEFVVCTVSAKADAPRGD